MSYESEREKLDNEYHALLAKITVFYQQAVISLMLRYKTSNPVVDRIAECSTLVKEWLVSGEDSYTMDGHGIYNGEGLFRAMLDAENVGLIEWVSFGDDEKAVLTEEGKAYLKALNEDNGSD